MNDDEVKCYFLDRRCLHVTRTCSAYYAPSDPYPNFKMCVPCLMGEMIKILGKINFKLNNLRR